MRTAGIRELKARLSAYLREVQHGETVLVTERGRVVAELRPPGSADAAATPAERRYQALVERGWLRPAAEPKADPWGALPRLKLPAGTAAALLAAERDE